jgi:dienelactone hydrolase
MAIIGFRALAHAQALPEGQVINKVLCLKNANQSYALYLPSNYSPDRKWPILYAFDAGARGTLPVQRFKAAAEIYGYIVAGSNNSQNGPIDIIEEALNALIADTESRLALDNRRVYLTGFSGGARVAAAAASAMKGKIAGIIGCGAGFHSEATLSIAKTFAFFGAIGTEDFNFPELRNLDNTLEKLGTIHALEIFEGGHDWPPERVCTCAIEWMEIQAMRSGIKELNEGWINEVYSRAVAEARAHESKQEDYEAYRRYSALARDFAWLKDISAFKAKAGSLYKFGGVKNAVNQEKSITEKQNRLEAEISILLEGAVSGENRAFRLQDLVRIFTSLREQADQTRNEIDRLVAVRLLSLFWIRLNEACSLDFENKSYNLAALRLELMTQIRPDSPQVFFHLARAYSLGGDKKGAIKALKTAASKGFKDIAELRNNPEFEAIKNDPAFVDILSTLKK